VINKGNNKFQLEWKQIFVPVYMFHCFGHEGNFTLICLKHNGNVTKHDMGLLKLFAQESSFSSAYLTILSWIASKFEMRIH